MNEFTSQFLIEARELTEQASKDLMALEERPNDRDLLEAVFRSFHTLKGAAGIMEYSAMERLLQEIVVLCCCSLYPANGFQPGA